jgi:HlyD family secretion protein
LLAITESPLPRLPRAIFYTVAALFAAVLAWALLAKVDIVAVAEGKLVPQSYVKIVQPAEAGIITDILVSEGDAVQAGQTLLRLDPTLTGADSRTLAADLALKRLALRRIDAELAGRQLVPQPGDDLNLYSQVQNQANSRTQALRDAIAQEQSARERAEHDLAAAQETLTKLKATLPSYQQSADAYRKLVTEGFVSPIAGNDKEREAIEKSQDLKTQLSTVAGLQATIAAQDKKIATLTSNYRSQLLTERTEVMGATPKLEEEARKVGFKQTLLELKAPQAGIVKDLATATKGAVVQPGMVLLTLVPRGEALVAEVQVKNEDIGFVQTGQPVRLKLAAYPFQKYGLVEGSVLTVAADSQNAGNGQTANAMNSIAGGALSAGTPGYKALVKLQNQHLEASSGDQTRRYALEAGMAVSAEIHQGRRTIMEYLLSPVSKTLHEAGRER